MKLRDFAALLSVSTIIPLPAAAATVVVKPGETLSGIAARELGEAGKWGELCKLNSSVLKNCDLVPVGAVLSITSDEPEVSPLPASPHSEVPKKVTEVEPLNLVQFPNDFASDYWSGYFIKPNIAIGGTDPNGGNQATKVESADKPDEPGLGHSGFFHAAEVDPGTYEVSVWLRTVSGNLDFRVGISDAFISPEVISIGEEWKKVELVVTVTEPTNRLFQVYEHTEKSPAWEIFAARVVRQQT